MKNVICCILVAMILPAQAQIGGNKIGNSMSKGVQATTASATGGEPDKKIGEKAQQGSVTAEKVLELNNPYVKRRLTLPFSEGEEEYKVKKVGPLLVLNGDILVGYDGPSTMSYSSLRSNYKWHNAVMPIDVDASVFYHGLLDDVQMAIKEINNRTGLCIIQRTNEKDFIRMIYSDEKEMGGAAGISCIGRQGGMQYLYLASTATKGVVIHELLHAAGFYHEQNRKDRDKFVDILEENIINQDKDNFEPKEGVPRGEYDYCSIMHYPRFAFSKDENTLPTINCIKDGKPIDCPDCMGAREGLSDLDIAGIDQLYQVEGREACRTVFNSPPYVIIPPSFPTTGGLTASDFAMEKFRHRFRKAEETGFAGAYPTFHEGRQGVNLTGPTIFLNKNMAIWADIPIGYLGNPVLNDFAARMRGVQEYAARAGFVGGFPNFYHENYGQGTVCGTILLGNEAAEWRDVPLVELGNPPLDDIGARMRTAHDYAVRNGYLSGFPNFFHAKYGPLIYCGIILVKHGAGTWKEIITVEGPR